MKAGTTQKILLIDDREDNLMSLEAILQPGGYHFYKARSGPEALKVLLHEFDFALILMDVSMPGMSGFETAELIYQREKLRHIPIIFITAHHSGEEQAYNGYLAGAIDYIYKPLHPDLLRAKVAVYIELYRKNQQLVAQEQKLKAINRSLELEVQERKISETRVKELNRQLIENIERLEAANRDLDRFAFMASHDLQEPLRKMIMFSDRLRTKYHEILGAEGKVFIDRIQAAGERMQALIKDILLFSKTSLERPAFAQVDLNAVLAEVIQDMDELIAEKQARIELHPLPSLYVNPVLMHPLFYNLISNSLKYSRPGVRPLIRIHADHGVPGSLREPEEYRPSGFHRIYVEDNGIGFDQKYAEQIFGMFKRLHAHDEIEGTGIGLALCKKIVEEHLGYITALSRVNEGSTFIISLPGKNVEALTPVGDL